MLIPSRFGVHITDLQTDRLFHSSNILVNIVCALSYMVQNIFLQQFVQGKKSTLHLNFEYPPKSAYKLQSLPSEGDQIKLVSKWQDQ